MRYFLRGLSLIELLLILFILNLLCSVAIPNWYHLQAETSARTTLDSLWQAIQFARITALQTHQVITVCGSQDQKNCSRSWSDGQIIFVTHSDSSEIQSPNAILRVYARSSRLGVITWKAFPARDYLQFLPSGETRSENGTLVYCPNNKDNRYAGAIVIGKTGRIRRVKLVLCP